jgi:hypothetical protein
LRPSNLPSNGTNKKQRIWALVSDGKYTPDQIASMVGTTIEYVWKETSRYRKNTTVTGLVVSRGTSELAKRKDETSIFLQGSDQIGGQGTRDISVSNSQARMIRVDGFHLNSKPDQFLNIPKMESVDLKTLYAEFNAGKKPVDVIAYYGYHPDIVEFEYHRFLRLSGIDVDALLKDIITDCYSYLEPQAELKLFIEKYHKEGHLQNEDIYELLRLKSEHEWVSRLNLSMIDPTETLPRGIVKLRCSFCNGPIPGALLESTSEIGRIILDQYTNLRCLECIDPETLDKLYDMCLQRISDRS